MTSPIAKGDVIIYRFSPPLAQLGQTINIYGANFTYPLFLSIGYAALQSYYFNSTQITAIVPSKSITGPIVVQTTTNGSFFTSSNLIVNTNATALQSILLAHPVISNQFIIIPFTTSNSAATAFQLQETTQLGITMWTNNSTAILHTNLFNSLQFTVLPDSSNEFYRVVTP